MIEIRMNSTYDFAYENRNMRDSPFIPLLIYLTFLDIKTDFYCIFGSALIIYEREENISQFQW